MAPSLTKRQRWRTGTGAQTTFPQIRMAAGRRDRRKASDSAKNKPAQNHPAFTEETPDQVTPFVPGEKER